MNARGLTTWAVWVVFLVLTANAARLVLERPNASVAVSNVVGGSPLRITPAVVYFDPPASTKVPQATLIVAVRSDGSLMKRFEAVNKPNPVSSRYLVFADGRIVTTDDILEEKTVRPDRANVRAMFRDPSSNCLRDLNGATVDPTEEVIGRKELLGYLVLALQARTPTGTRTVWLAPALGCVQLQLRTVHPSGEMLEQRATRVLAGDPPAEMFDVPKRYRDVPKKTRR